MNMEGVCPVCEDYTAESPDPVEAPGPATNGNESHTSDSHNMGYVMDFF